jgi:hypothetical protein
VPRIYASPRREPLIAGIRRFSGEPRNVGSGPRLIPLHWDVALIELCSAYRDAIASPRSAAKFFVESMTSNPRESSEPTRRRLYRVVTSQDVGPNLRLVWRIAGPRRYVGARGGLENKHLMTNAELLVCSRLP